MTTKINQTILKVAKRNPDFRRALVAELRKLSMEFDTEEALKTYLKEHPGADRSLHKVVKKKDSKGKAKVNTVEEVRGVWKTTVQDLKSVDDCVSGDVRPRSV